MIDLVVPCQPCVQRIDIVYQTYVHIGVKLSDVIEVERGEQAVPPTECGVCIDDQVPVLLGEIENVFEYTAAELAEPGHRQIEYSPGRDVRSLFIHPPAEMAEINLLAPLLSDPADLLQILALIQADCSCNNYFHGISIWIVFI